MSGRCGFGCFIEGADVASHERTEHTACTECGSEPIGKYPVGHKPSCSRMTIAPHLWPCASGSRMPS